MIRTILPTSLLLLVPIGFTTAQQPEQTPPMLAKDHHPWTRFPIGSWRRVQIIEQIVDADLEVSSQSVTIKMEKLVDVSEHEFSLEHEIHVDVGGQNVQVPPSRLTLGLLTGEPGAIESVVELEAEMVAMEGRDVPARVLEVVTSGQAYPVRTRIWYSPDIAPHFLRTVCEAVSPGSEETAWRRTSRILATGLPFFLRERGVRAAFLAEQHVSAKLTRDSIIVQVEEVPGGVVARWTKETNIEGRLTRTEVETLLDWGVGDDRPEGTEGAAIPPAENSRDVPEPAIDQS